MSGYGKARMLRTKEMVMTRGKFISIHHTLLRHLFCIGFKFGSGIIKEKQIYLILKSQEINIWDKNNLERSE